MRLYFLKYIAVFVLLFGCVLTAGQLDSSAQGVLGDAQDITAGQSVTGSLSIPVEVDCYRLTLDKNGYVEIDFTASASGEWKITLMDESREIFSRSSDDETVKVGVESGVYYIMIAPVKYSAAEYTLTAGFTASEVWEREFNDSRETARKLIAGTSVTGNLSTLMDVDCYSFSIDEPRYVSFSFDTALPSNSAAWALTVLDEKNSEVIYSSISKSTNTESTVLQPGNYIAEIAAIDHSSGDYTLTLNVSDEMVAVRIEGASRIQTAISISREGWEYGSADAAVLANAYNYPDALAGVSLAYALDAPILLTSGEMLEPEVLREIERLGADKIYLLGGELVISGNVVKALSNSGYKVERVAGKSRFDTAVEIAKKLESVTGKKPTEVFFAYSHGYADALSISGVAAIKGCPVLYVAADGKLSESSAQFVSSCGAEKAIILGGKLAISTNAEGNIKKIGVNTVNRISGSTRYDTCLAINKAYANILTGDAVCAATGTNYPDALAGGVFAAANKAPLLLVGTSLTDAQKQYLSQRDAASVYVFGGTLAVSDEVIKQIRSTK